MLKMEAITAINLTSLKPWYKPSSEEISGLQSSSYDDKTFKFCVSSRLNKKIFLCQGGITQLKLDCIVLPINEMTLTKSSLSVEVHRAAGNSLFQYYHDLKDMKTGNVVLGSGFDLPSRYIIHVKEPGMNAKFLSAVENALHRCYHNVMQLAFENKLRTIGFSSLYENVTYMLNEDMTHMALSTVRCFLEKHSDHFDAIVFSVGKGDLDLYLKLLPAYFPRSNTEAEQASCHLAMRNLSEWGDKVKEDRAIRISHLPLHEASSSNGTETVASSPSELPPIDPCLKTPFSCMDGDHDMQRRKQINVKDIQKSSVTRERIYRRLLLLSRAEDMTSLSATRSLCVCGCDRQGHSLVVVVANRINLTETNPEKALLFLIRTLDPVVNSKYSLVYFHTMSQSHNHPSVSFIKRMYNTLDDRYHDNLKRFYMVHPSVASRVFTWFFTTFTAGAIKRQVVTIKNIPQLYKYIAPDQIDIPPFVSDFDLKVNLEVYQKEVARSSSNRLPDPHCEL